MALVGTTEIAKRINKLGFRSKNGKFFSSKAILRIIRNPRYKGDVPPSFRPGAIGYSRGPGCIAMLRAVRQTRWA